MLDNYYNSRAVLDKRKFTSQTSNAQILNDSICLILQTVFYVQVVFYA